MSPVALPRQQTSASTRVLLRHATADLHRELDAAVMASDPFVSLPAYTGFLQRLLAARRAVKARYGCLGPSGYWSDRAAAATALLESDLRTIGASPPTTRTDSSLDGAACSDSEGWGIAYVLEGSLLGGRVLGSRLRAGLGVGFGSQYLDLTLADPTRWQSFCTDLEGADWNERICSAALVTFELHRREWNGD